MIGWDLTHKPFAFVHTFYAMLSLLWVWSNLIISSQSEVIQSWLMLSAIIYECHDLMTLSFVVPFDSKKMTMRNAKPHKKRFQKLIKNDSNSFFSNCKQKYLLITFLKDTCPSRYHLTYRFLLFKYLLYICLKIAHSHGVWKSKKKSHSTLRAKRATFTFWVDKS